MGVSGAVAVNVQHSQSHAEVQNGVNITAESLIAVTALNGTTSRVKANASTTKSNTGVGVGVAVNIVGLKNIARMGDGDFEAAMLKVAATTKEVMPEEKKTDKTPRNKNELSSQLGEVVGEYMDDLAKEIGLDQYVPADMLSGILSPIVKEVTGEILKETLIK